MLTTYLSWLFGYRKPFHRTTFGSPFARPPFQEHLCRKALLQDLLLLHWALPRVLGAPSWACLCTACSACCLCHSLLITSIGRHHSFAAHTTGPGPGRLGKVNHVKKSTWSKVPPQPWCSLWLLPPFQQLFHLLQSPCRSLATYQPFEQVSPVCQPEHLLQLLERFVWPTSFCGSVAFSSSSSWQDFFHAVHSSSLSVHQSFHSLPLLLPPPPHRPCPSLAHPLFFLLQASLPSPLQLQPNLPRQVFSFVPVGGVALLQDLQQPLRRAHCSTLPPCLNQSVATLCSHIAKQQFSDCGSCFVQAICPALFHLPVKYLFKEALLQGLLSAKAFALPAQSPSAGPTPRCCCT